jgi:hypothetical protein
MRWDDRKNHPQITQITQIKNNDSGRQTAGGRRQEHEVFSFKVQSSKFKD